MAAYLIKDNIIDHIDQQPEAVTSFELANEKEFPLVSFCWNKEHFLKIMAEICGHSTQVNHLHFLRILQTCLAANMSTEAVFNLEGIAWIWDVDTLIHIGLQTRPFDGGSYFKTSINGQWSMLIHPELGPCYTFEIDKSNPMQEIVLHPNYSEPR